MRPERSWRPRTVLTPKTGGRNLEVISEYPEMITWRIVRLEGNSKETCRVLHTHKHTHTTKIPEKGLSTSEPKGLRRIILLILTIFDWFLTSISFTEEVGFSRPVIIKMSEQTNIDMELCTPGTSNSFLQICVQALLDTYYCDPT